MVNKRLLVVVTLTFGFALSSHAQVEYGPLQTYSQSPFQTNALSPQLRSGFSLPIDAKELFITGTIASIWAVTETYELDYYQNQIALGGTWQLNAKWQLALNYRWNYAGNNHLDGLTTAFHDAFGLDQNGRKDVDENRFVISIPEYDIDEDNFRGETLSNALTLYAQYQLIEKAHHGASLGLSWYFNNADQSILSTSKFQQALQINYGYIRNQHRLDAIVSFTCRHSSDVLGSFPTKETTLSTGLSYRYRFWQDHQLIGQLMVYEGISEGRDEFSKPATEFTLGYRYQFEHSAVELTATENMFNADNSTDIAFSLGYRYRF
ncbi:DUF3187 family protein [Vibrio sp. TRT 21S02]|uniref:DUF3187 family protein n=1 Tax=Vibrio sp. TRT 21S02 TaxID=3418507 RepID=UPI003CEB9B7A